MPDAVRGKFFGRNIGAEKFPIRGRLSANRSLVFLERSGAFGCGSEPRCDAGYLRNRRAEAPEAKPGTIMHSPVGPALRKSMAATHLASV